MARILVAENDLNLNAFIGRTLTQRGHDVVLALDGEEALSKVSPPWPDLMLLDVTLPKIDGFEVCRQMASRTEMAGIPVIFLTARGGAEDFERSRHMPNFAGYFITPYATLDMLRHIDKVLAVGNV
ncbi:MAG TPA: response regulator [Candidatus Xenobia bacterium]|jgi:DNA-binding response OmpR family regulator